MRLLIWGIWRMIMMMICEVDNKKMVVHQYTPIALNNMIFYIGYIINFYPLVYSAITGSSDPQRKLVYQVQ